MTSYHLTHLKQLEAESIHIIREVAAEFERPVMLYSVGKDSRHVATALKAFFRQIAFKLLHVDTTWKFREMIEFRDKLMRDLGWILCPHQRRRGQTRRQPFYLRSKRHTDIMKTDALKQALSKYQFDAAFGGARRDEEKSAPRNGSILS